MRTKTSLLPGIIPALCLAALAACNIDSTSVVEHESRLAIGALFAINGDGSVTLGWTAPLPPAVPKPGHGVGDPDDAGALLEVLIYRGDRPDFQVTTSTLIGSAPASTDRFVDSAAVNGSTYHYRAVPVGLLAGGLRKAGDPTATAVGRPYDYSAVTAIRYGEHVDRIFASGCAVSGCHAGVVGTHGPGTPERTATADDGNTGGLSLKGWQDLMMGGAHGSVVVAFRPEKSHLLFHVNDDTLLAPVSTPHMPLPGFQLPRAQVELLRRWIAEGCRSDVGAVPFAAWPSGRVLITNQAEDLVAVVDRATNLTGRYIRAGAASTLVAPPEAPHNVTVDEARGVYYVNLIGSGKVLRYRLDTNELVDQVGGIISPTQVALSPTGDTAFVAQFSAGVNAIKILRTDPLQVIGEISALNVDKPHGVQVTPDGRELWVTGNLSDNLLVVNLADLSTRLVLLTAAPPGQGGVLLPYQTAMTPDNRKVYVTNQRGNTVSVVDRLTYEVVKAIPVGENPLIPSITPDGRLVLVPNRNTDDLTVIDTGTDTVIATIGDVGPQPHGSAVTPDGRHCYVSCENVTALVPPHHPTTGSRNPGFYAVIDLATLEVMARYETGAFAAGVAVTSR